MTTSSPSNHDSQSNQHTPLTPDTPTTAGPNNDHFKVVRKRNRVPLSCAPCRARKLKCNRSTPCENCSKRGEPSTCSYAAPGARRKTGSRNQPSGTPDDMQNRIDKLEGLVLSLMGSGNEPAPQATTTRTMSMSTSSASQSALTPQDSDYAQRENSVDSETDRVAKSFGVLHFNNNQTSYIGDAHWATILHEISEVKNYFKEHQKQYEDALKTVEESRKQAGIQVSGPAFLLAGRNPPDFKELVNRLPRRPEVDLLVQRYFSDSDPGHCVLHIPTWRKNYESYWHNPGGSDASFLGQLYSLCGLAMQSYYKNQDEPYEYQGRTRDLAAMYRGLTQQCLQLVDYSKIEQTTIETLILHVHAEYQKVGEPDIGLWVLSRMVISLAMRTGLHRDAKNFPGITPFQCEIRRRLWAFLRILDTTWSFSVGLPSMIRDNDTDAELPSNLKDEDFHEETEKMPPSRSRNDFTDASYLIAKAELAIALSKVVATVTGTGTISYEKIVSLNDELRDVYHGIFPVLQVQNAEDVLTSSNMMAVMRMNLSLLYNKSVCVLHRKYLGLSRENTRFSPSRQACIDASLALLRNQQILDKEYRPGGRMHRSQYHVASPMTHDFILAGTLVSLDLLASVQAEASGRSSGDIELWGRDRKDEQLQAIEGARAIWDSLRDRYVEAYKAYSICGVMIQKIQHYMQQIRTQQMAQGAVQYAVTSINGNKSTYGQNNMGKPEHSAAMTLGMLSGGTPNSDWKSDNLSSTPSAGQAPSTGQSDVAITPNFPVDTSMLTPSTFPFFGAMGEATPANMDWNAWDEYMQNPNLDASLNNDIWPQNFDFMATNYDPNQILNTGQAAPLTQTEANMFTNPSTLLPPGTAM